MANVIELASKAKINLSLDITGRRENGYHELATIMQNVELADTVRLEKSDRIEITSNLFYLPTDQKNIAYKMAEHFFRETGVKGGVKITLRKKIPVAAGMAGGSSNGAAVLKGLNKLYETGLTLEEMQAMSLKIGSDIPFCLLGGTALVTGIGEITERLPPMPACRIVLCKPPFGISTEAAYRAYDSHAAFTHPDTAGMVKALEEGDLLGIASKMRNVLEDVVTAPEEIAEIEKVMRSHGALGARMSGSGPTVFGIFAEREKAEECRRALYKVYRDTWSVSPEHVPV